MTHPTVTQRIYSTWFRHFRVYTRHLFSNGLPPFIEPFFFLVAVGLGVGQYINEMGGESYIVFLASAMMVSPAMYTAVFECTFGTFIRMEFDKVYDGMLASSVSVKDIFAGEILFCGTKGLFFSGSFVIVIAIFGLLRSPMGLLTPFVGMLTGMMFASLSLLITSFVKTINYFNFFISGFITPIFFLSGIIFPLSNLPDAAKVFGYIMPLYHPAQLARALYFGEFKFDHLYSLLYILTFIVIVSFLALRRMEKRLID